MEQLLPEDYVTCLSEDENGTIWIGTRRKGFMAIDPVTGRRGTGDRASMGMADNYVSAILPMPDAMPLIGLYIGGVIKPQMELSLKAKNKPKEGRPIYSVARSHFAPLPSAIKPPTVAEIKSMQAKLEKLNKPLPKVYAAYYGEDWKTQGDWVGRYGRRYAVMCGAAAPFDQHFASADNRISVHPFIGLHKTKDDSLRRWVHWLKTDNPKVMYSPLNGYRRQAEWDDHAEAYPMTHNGPDLWYLLEIKDEGTGKLYDAKAGLQWNINRWYDPNVGRWCSEDPIGFRGKDVNLYRYVNSNQLVASDPHGKHPALVLAGQLASSSYLMWGHVANLLTLTQVINHFTQVNTNIVVPESGSPLPILAMTTGQWGISIEKRYKNILFPEPPFNQAFPNIPEYFCPEELEISAKIKVFDADVFSNDEIHTFSSGPKFVGITPEMIGDMLNVAFGASTYVTCRNTTTSTCVSIEGNEVCDPFSAVDLYYSISISSRAWGKNAVSKWEESPIQDRFLAQVSCQ